MDKMKGFFSKMILDVSPLVKALMDFSDRILAKLLQRSDNISKVYFALSKRIFAPLGGVITHIGKVLEEKVLPLMDMTGGSAGSFGETLSGDIRDCLKLSIVVLTIWLTICASFVGSI